jgi:ribosomal protein S21
VSYLKVDEEALKILRKYGVKKARVVNDVFEVEFFPSVEEVEKRSKAEEEKDAAVNPSTGLTKAQSRDLLGMDE